MAIIYSGIPLVWHLVVWHSDSSTLKESSPKTKFHCP